MKRKFNWTVEWREASPAYRIIAPEETVRLYSRPTVTIEETVAHYMNTAQWIPGKSGGQTTITYLDAENTEGGALFLHWISEQYKGTSEKPFTPERACAILRLYDGNGTLTESWYLEDAFVTSVNFGEMDISSTTTMLEVTVKYADADYVAGNPATWLKPLEQEQQQEQ